MRFEKFTRWILVLAALSALIVASAAACGDDDDDDSSASTDDDTSDDDTDDDDDTSDDDTTDDDTVDDDTVDDDTADDDSVDDDDDGLPKIAVISDIHAWYPETELGDDKQTPDYPALMVHEPLEYIRNEIPDIFRAAVHDAIDRGARYILINGDFSRSVERAVYAAITKEMKEFEEDYGIDFIYVRGNHDFDDTEFVDSGRPGSVPLFGGDTLDNYWTEHLGAEEMAEMFAPFGMSATEHDGNPEEYLFYERGPATENGCGTLEPDGECVTQTQFTYVFEPFEDVWVLVLDTNGFSTNGGGSGWEPDNFKRAKPRSWDWMWDVYDRAAKQGKSVIAFGHHNLGDPLVGLTFDYLGGVFDELVFNTKQSAEELAKMGMGLYVSGHLHMNYISVTEKGKHRMIDIQAPALTNYPVAYRMLTFEDARTMQVETIVVRDVPNWDRYIDDYKSFAAAGDYPFEKFEVEQSATFDEFVNRTFRNMITTKIGDSLLDALKVIPLYSLMQLTEAGKSLDLASLESGEWLEETAGSAVAASSLDEKIEGAGLSVETFKAMSMYDFVFATIDIQFGAAHAFVKMEQAGTLEYFRFFMDQITFAEKVRNRPLIEPGSDAAVSETTSLVGGLLGLVGNVLQEYWWQRPYIGTVRIGLDDQSIEAID
ncbi:MAG: metallophosphoesterase [Deltaproteobacteria bacterium]|nr:metallophosphoesterase [Deltaproteobacteria bacterium]